MRHADADEIRGFFAKRMFVASQSADPRLERAFELVPREAFLPPPPWKIYVGSRYIETPSADPCYIYQDVLVGLDVTKGINNGEPFLHARWIGAVAPEPGESLTHIGTGSGYYTAILSMLVRPGGRVAGFEIEPELAEMARNNLEAFENVTVNTGDAVALELPPSDVIYVNAGAIAPPVGWLTALRPGGRLIFPWRPLPGIGLALVVKREAAGFAVQPLMPAWFIPCAGISDADTEGAPPDKTSAWSVRSVHLRTESEPDDSAVAVYPRIWFSSALLTSKPAGPAEGRKE
jgi:protein-L-isoaspartate(D-aspartate) O-methyltransferase